MVLPWVGCQLALIMAHLPARCPSCQCSAPPSPATPGLGCAPPKGRTPRKGTDSHPLQHTQRARRAGGLPMQLGRWPCSPRPRDYAWAEPPEGQPDTPPHTHTSVLTYTDAAAGPASFWTVPTLPPDPGGARTPPGIDLGIWVPTGHPGMPVPHKAQPGAVQNE